MPPPADHPDDRRRADVGLEAKEHVGEEVRQDLGDDAKGDHVEAPGADGGHSLDLAGIDGLDRLGQELAEHAAGVDAEGQHAGKGPEAHRGDEHEGEDELVHCAEHVHHPARREVDERVGAEVAGPEQAEGHRDREGEHSAPEGDAYRHHALPRVLPDVREGRVQIAAEEDADVADVADQLQGPQLDDARGQAEHDRQRDGCQRGRPAADGSGGAAGAGPGVDRGEGPLSGCPLGRRQGIERRSAVGAGPARVPEDPNSAASVSRSRARRRRAAPPSGRESGRRSSARTRPGGASRSR